MSTSPRREGFIGPTHFDAPLLAATPTSTSPNLTHVGNDAFNQAFAMESICDEEVIMQKVIASLSMSLDGFVAGVDSGPEFPLGRHGERLHTWMADPANGAAIALDDIGAVLIGNTMFCCGEGPWGDENPYGRPVFVLTHTPREPLMRRGEVAFRFLTHGLHDAVAQVRTAAAGRDLLIGGGADVVRQAIGAGFVTGITLTIVPVRLGSGVPFFSTIDPAIGFTQVAVDPRPGVTHLTYAVTGSPTP